MVVLFFAIFFKYKDNREWNVLEINENVCQTLGYVALSIKKIEQQQKVKPFLIVIVDIT